MITHLQPTTDAARRYLDEAAAQLDDLPVEERGELLSDIADALAEVEGSDAADFDRLVLRLGRPAAFADEIRRSSGAPARNSVGGADEAGQQESGPSVRDRVIDASSERLAWAGRELEPIWWVLRGGLVAVVSAVVIGFRLYDAVALTSVLVVASIALGARARSRAVADPTPRANLLRGLAILIAAPVLIVVAMGITSGSSDVYYVEEPSTSAEREGALSSPANGDITNIYAFDADGNRLLNVRLFDQIGLPVDVGASSEVDPLRRRVVDASGTELRNAFPIRYVDESTGTVLDPDAGWPTSPGPIAAPATTAAVDSPATTAPNPAPAAPPTAGAAARPGGAAPATIKPKPVAPPG